MPFDNPLPRSVPVTADTPAGQTLGALGIQPVPRERAEAHKTMVIKDWRRDKSRALLHDAGRVGWRTRWLCPYRDGVKPSFCFIKVSLQHGPLDTRDRSPAPKELIRLAASVHRLLPEPRFSIDYFDDDPILNVSYVDDTGQAHTDCLGIWDRGRVLAIATVTRRRSWLDWLRCVG